MYYSHISPDKIIVLILSTVEPNYSSFKQAIYQTWFKELEKSGIKCFFYSGNSSQDIIKKDEICVNAPDNLKGTAIKFLKATNLVLKEYPSTQIIFRTNLSSYIDVKNFIAFINSRNIQNDDYTGVIGSTTYYKEYFYGNRIAQIILTHIPLGERIDFVSGAGIFLGRNVLDSILSDNKTKPLHLIDDIMIAKYLKNIGIFPNKDKTPLRFDIKSDNSHKIDKLHYDFMLQNNLLFHYKFKTSDRKHDADMLKLFHNPEYRLDICTK